MTKHGLAGTVRTLTAVAALATIAVAGSASATTVTLDFNSLPSAQGWTFVGAGGLTEAGVFSVDGTTLRQNTIGGGFSGWGYYQIPGILDPALPYTIDVTARVLREELSSPGAFSFLATETSLCSAVYLCVSDIGVVNGGPPVSFMFDNSQFHDYRLEVSPGAGSWILLIDGVLQASGVIDTTNLPNLIYFGDVSSGVNGEAEITRYVFEQPLQPAPLPAALPLFGAALAGLAAAAGYRRRTRGA